jgi:hypothetical protein
MLKYRKTFAMFVLNSIFPSLWDPKKNLTTISRKILRFFNPMSNKFFELCAFDT